MMENLRLLNMGSNKVSNSTNGISSTERESHASSVHPPSARESQDPTTVINSTNGFTNPISSNATVRPPLPPPYVPLPPTGPLPMASLTQSTSNTAGLGASSRSSGARSSSRSSHHRSGKKGSSAGLSPRSKSSSSSGSALRPKACRLCGQPHSYHEPHLYNYKYVKAKCFKFVIPLGQLSHFNNPIEYHLWITHYQIFINQISGTKLMKTWHAKFVYNLSWSHWILHVAIHFVELAY